MAEEMLVEQRCGPQRVLFREVRKRLRLCRAQRRSLEPAMQPCLLTERPGEDLLRYAIGRLHKHRVVPFLRTAARAPARVLLFISGCDAATLQQCVAARI